MFALDIGGTNTRYGIIDGNKQISGQASFPTPKTSDRFLDTLRSVIAAHQNEDLCIIGIPGTVNHQLGTLDRAPNIPLDAHFPLAEHLASLFSTKKFMIYNDADLIALGEYGETQPYSNEPFIVLTLGTGIGSGIIVNKKLLTGIHGYGSEAGHMIIDFSDQARVCSCGKKGCLEAYFSAKAFCEIYYNETGTTTSSAVQAIDYFKKNNPPIIETALNAFASAIAGYINIFHPSHIRYYGGLKTIVNNNYEHIGNLIDSNLFSVSFSEINFSETHLQDSAYLYGAFYAANGFR